MSEKRAGIRIDKERCKGCLLCIDVCPQKILRAADTVNKKGQRYVVVIEEDKCTGCGMCALVCPDCAIEIAGEGAAASGKVKGEKKKVRPKG